MVYSGTVVYNGVTIGVTSLSVSKVQTTRKQVIGKTLVQIQVLGITSQEYELTITGVLVDDKDANRTALEASDDATAHAYTDGIYDGNYYIKTGSLRFDDSGDKPSHYTFIMTLVQE